MKHAFFVAIAIALVGCSAGPKQYAENKAGGDAWLQQNRGKSSASVSGMWHLTGSDWNHKGQISQSGSTISGTLDDYAISGVVNGSTVYFLFQSDGWNHYSAVVTKQGSQLKGHYSDRVPFEPKRKYPIVLTKLSN